MYSLKNEKFVSAIGNLSDEYVLEALKPVKARKQPWRKALAIAAALTFVLLASVPALAAVNVEGAYELLYAAAPTFAQRLKPVNLSDTDQGICMTLQDAAVEGNTAIFRLALRDLEGSRIDETTDLFDSYTIRTGQDLKGHCQLENYDSETRTAVFLAELQSMDGQPLRLGKVTFSLYKILSGKQETEASWDGSLQDAAKEALWQPSSSVSIRGGGGEDYPLLSKTDRFLSPQAPFWEPAQGVSLTAIGYADGFLRVQMHYADILRYDNHGDVRLLQGKENLPCAGMIAYWDEEKNGSYEEYFFLLSEDALSECSLTGWFVTASQLTEGRWQVTFPIP